MEKFAYSDGSDLCLREGERALRGGSDFIRRYREREEEAVKKNEWKYAGSGAQFRGDTFEEHGIDRSAAVNAAIHSVNVGEENEVVYTFTVGQTSGAVRKDMSRAKDGEEILLHTNDYELLSADYDAKAGKLIAERQSGISADIVLLDIENGDYVSVTEGDSRDENPAFSVSEPGTILYNSYPVGRNARGEFCEYGPSAIYRCNLETQRLDELVSDAEFSYIKPRDDGEGNLYCIKKPARDKRRRGNPFLEILLIPVRILQAIANFIQIFVVFFSGKTLTGGGNNPAKGQNVDSREMFIKGNIVKVDEEIARNKKLKDKDLGFIPASWKLVKISAEGETELKAGICDFCLCGGALLCTNGKKVFKLTEGGCEKIADGNLILSVAAPAKKQ